MNLNDIPESSIHVDSMGRPIIILKSVAPEGRKKGLTATKANILAARTIATILRSSLGPKGLDKIMVGPDGDLTVTNDGATILTKMDIHGNTIAHLLVELAKSQDDEIGDGTTSVVVFAGALLEQAEELLKKGIHPIRIAQGYDQACQVAVNHLRNISHTLTFSTENRVSLIQAALTSLSSKIVNRLHLKFAEIAVDAVLSVANLETRDVNFDLIKIECHVGGKLEDSRLIHGIAVDKPFSHTQMPKTVKDAKICLLTCPFEAPKIKTKYTVDIKSAADFNSLHDQEQSYFKEMISKLKEAGCTLAISQWGFEDEANHLLMANGIPALRWVSGPDLELLALATGARFVPRFEEIDPKKLGTCGRVYEQRFDAGREDSVTIFESFAETKAVTVLIRGGNELIIEEAKRSLHDAMCVTRNLIRDPRIVYGGCAPEISCSLAVSTAAQECGSVEQYGMRAFARAMETLPLALAENSGLNPIEAVTSAKALQTKTGNHNIGIDCNNVNENGNIDMKTINVFDTYEGKKNSFRMATQLSRMILKVDETIILDPHQ